MKVRLKKSKIPKKINNIDYVVTESRKIKHGSEVEVELLGNEKGGACIKFFGPNKKKEYTVVVNKLKKFEEKFVKIVTMDVVIPIIDSILLSIKNGDSEQSLKSDQQESNICKTCGKRFANERTLKIHSERMHGKDPTVSKLKRKEMSVLKGTKQIQEGFQRLNTYACVNCDFKTVDYDEIQRHERDSHRKKVVEISPNSKKVKNVSSDIEPMELDSKNDIVDAIIGDTEKEVLIIDFQKVIKQLEELKCHNEDNNNKIKNLQLKVDELARAECSKCHKDESRIENNTNNDIITEESEVSANDNNMDQEDSESQWTCNECDFQTNEEW